MKNKLTIVIPVKEKEIIVSRFIEGNKTLLESNRVIVINSKGGEQLKRYSGVYINDTENKYTLSEARRLGIDLVNTNYILNLDVDSILPEGYIEQALNILENNYLIGAVSLDYNKLQGHLAFGLSVWRTNLLKALYDWKDPTKIELCECLYMWGRLNRTRFRLETINKRAQHLKEMNRE